MDLVRELQPRAVEEPSSPTQGTLHPQRSIARSWQHLREPFARLTSLCGQRVYKRASEPCPSLSEHCPAIPNSANSELSFSRVASSNPLQPKNFEFEVRVQDRTKSDSTLTASVTRSRQRPIGRTAIGFRAVPAPAPWNAGHDPLQVVLGPFRRLENHQPALPGCK